MEAAYVDGEIVISFSLQSFDRSLRSKSFYQVCFALILCLDFYLMYKTIGLFPPRNYLTALLAPLVIIDIQKLELRAFLYRYWPSLSILGINLLYICLSILQGHPDGVSYYSKELLKLSTLSFALQFISYRISLSFIVKTLFTVIGISTLVALLQLIAPELGWGIRSAIDYESFEEFDHLNGRPAGLSYFYLMLAEQHIMLMPLIIVGFRTYFTDNKTIWVSSNLAFFTIVLLMGNRGATLAYLLCLLLYWLVSTKKNLKTLATFAITSVSVVALLFVMRDEIRTIGFERHNDDRRIDAVLASGYIIKENPIWGIGSKFQNIKDKMAHVAKANPDNFIRANRVGRIKPHNYFLNTQLIYGVVGTLINIAIVFYALKKGGLLFLAISIFSFNYFFHNYGFLNHSSALISLLIYLRLTHNEGEIVPEQIVKSE